MKTLSKFFAKHFAAVLKYGLLLVVLFLAVATRFFPATQPVNGLVFDEAYFLPQVESYVVNRYFFDIHPPLGKLLMYYTTIAVNPDAAEQLDPELLANKVDDYKSPLNKDGIRLAPKIVGVLIPPLLFLVMYELLWLGRGRKKGENPDDDVEISLVSFGIGVFGVFANIIVVESRYALLTPFLLTGILLSLFLLLKYANARSQRAVEVYFILASIALGLALGVKWLALSLVPIFGLVILVREFKRPQRKRDYLKLASIYIQRFTFLGAAALTVYLGLFYWHFNQIKHYSPAAWEVSEAYQEELRTGEKQVSFLNKVIEWHQIAVRYSENVPKLDYTKPDEIGSMWATWPLMARPISYYWQTDGDGEYDHVFLIGNPLLWVISLAGVISLSAMGIAWLLLGSRTVNFRLRHLMIILFYFGNWLPFALISRVMYLYHYIPAYMFGLIAFGLVLHDFCLPRVRQIWISELKLDKDKLDLAVFLTGLTTLVAVMIIFFIYAPFTYLLPLDRDGFYNRVLIKEWNMIWPADK